MPTSPTAINLAPLRLHQPLAPGKEIGWVSLLLSCCATGFCLAVLSGLRIPSWFQPTLAGAIWGSLFVIGLYASRFHRVGGVQVLLSALVAVLLVFTFQRITDFSLYESLFLAAVLLSAGWLIAQTDRLQNPGAAKGTPTSRPAWTIADAMFVTTMCACFCQAAPQIVSEQIWFFSVLISLAAGLFTSWVAYRWTWNDEWTLIRFSSVALGLATAFCLVWRYSPGDTTIIETLEWMIQGPVTVIASQATTVLIALALRRFEARYLS